MNKIIMGIILVTSSLLALEFHTYSEAKEMQKKSGKIIMIDVIRTNCHYCRDMQVNVFDNEDMSQWLQKRFIAVKINLDFDELPLGLSVYFTPTFFFVNSEEQIVKKIPGSWDIKDFKELTKDIK
ncbi:thioredoxin family protein [Sulfurimonas sp.]